MRFCQKKHALGSHIVLLFQPQDLCLQVEFYVCEGLDAYDMVLGQDFDICCQKGSGEGFFVHSCYFIFMYEISVTNPLLCLEHIVDDKHIFNLNKFITSIDETAQTSFVIQREEEFEYEYHGSADTEKPINPAPALLGSDILTDMLVKSTGTGIRTSMFSNQLTSLHYLLQLHGFSDLSNSVRECKIMLSHHLLNGDCLRFDHLCQTINHVKLPDQTACRILSNGFVHPFDMTQAIVKIVSNASSQEISMDNLLILADSIGLAEPLKLSKNIRRDFIANLQKFAGQAEYRATNNPVSYDTFHDLLFGIERCNSGTLRAILCRHRITVDLKTKKNDMINLILTHISDGHCWNTSEIDEEKEACQNVQQTIEAGSSISDSERKIKILQYLKDTLPRLPILRLLEIENISHDSSYSLKKLREVLQSHIQHLQAEEDACIKKSWPHQVSQNLKEKIAKLFLQDTSSHAWATFVCASCGEDSLLKDKNCVNEKDISLTPLYRPDVRHSTTSAEFPVDEQWLNSACTPPHIIDNISDVNALLDPNGISPSHNEQGKVLSFCSECYKHLIKGKTPPLALANHMFIGNIPPELQQLTMVEESVIARCRAKTWVVQLQEKNDAINLPNIQRGFKGHTIIYPQQAESLAKILPPSVPDACTPICVIFIGSQKPSKEWLKTKAKPLVVRREKIRKALEWLKEHNPAYQNIQIDHRIIDEYPDCDVLPYHIEHVKDQSLESLNTLTARYDNSLRNECQMDPCTADLSQPNILTENGQEPVTHNPVDDVPGTHDATGNMQNIVDINAKHNQGTDETIFENVVITDVDGNATSNQLRAAAMRHIKQKGRGYCRRLNSRNTSRHVLLFPLLPAQMSCHKRSLFLRHVRVSQHQTHPKNRDFG
jgi:hypothetical protein